MLVVTHLVNEYLVIHHTKQEEDAAEQTVGFELSPLHAVLTAGYIREQHSESVPDVIHEMISRLLNLMFVRLLRTHSKTNLSSINLKSINPRCFCQLIRLKRMIDADDVIDMLGR